MSATHMSVFVEARAHGCVLSSASAVDPRTRVFLMSSSSGVALWRKHVGKQTSACAYACVFMYLYEDVRVSVST